MKKLFCLFCICFVLILVPKNTYAAELDEPATGEVTEEYSEYISDVYSNVYTTLPLGWGISVPMSYYIHIHYVARWNEGIDGYIYYADFTLSNLYINGESRSVSSSSIIGTNYNGRSYANFSVVGGGTIHVEIACDEWGDISWWYDAY